MEKPQVMRLRIPHVDGREPYEVVVPLKAMVEADRYCRQQGVQLEGPEGMGYLAYRASVLAGVVPPTVSFDEWLSGVGVPSLVEEGPGESPAPPA